jgi:hypothetical protein
MSKKTINALSVDDLLKAMARALTSESGLDDFHRFAAQQEASVHEDLERRAESGDIAA